MKLLLILITLLTATTHSWAGEEDYIIWKYNNNSPIENVYFGGDNDEFIYIVGQYTLYKMSTQDKEILDTINYPKGLLSNAISHERNEVYVSAKDSLFAYNLSNFKENRKILNIPPSGKINSEGTLSFYKDIKISADNKYLVYVYQESNGTTFERLNQIIIYDLDNDIIVKRFDHNKSKSNLIDFKISYENPTFIEQDSKIIFSSKTNSKDSLLSQVFKLDYNSDEFEEVMEARNKIHTNTDYFPLNENVINISESSLPEATRFNILDINTLTIASNIDFKNSENYIAPYKPFKYNSNLFLVTLYNHSKQSSSFTILDISTNDTSLHYSNIPHRSGNLNISKNKELLISYSSDSIFLHDLTKYIAETSVENTKELERFLYPNPTTNNVRIETSCSFAETRIELFNINGIILKNEVLPVTDSLVTFDLSGFPSGSYFIRLNCGEEIKTYNVIKEN